jgi:hypothetical protein
MIPGRVGVATPIVIHKTVDGIMDCYGTTVPSDAASGYAVGCTFHKTDADVLFSGTCSAVGTATTLTDSSLTATFDTDNELIGLLVIVPSKQIMGIITDYVQSTGVVTVADWTTYSSVAVANTIFPTATSTFKVLRVSTPHSLYTNVGDQAQGCKFKEVITTDYAKFTAVDHQVGPSAQLWKDCPIMKMIIDPGFGFYYFDDFMGPGVTVGADATADAAGWTTTLLASAADAEMGPVIGAGGEIQFTELDGTKDQSINAQLLNCCVKPAAGKTIWFEARIQVNEIDNHVFIGMSSTDTTLIASGVMDETSPSLIGFFTDQNSGSGLGGTITEKAGANDTTEDNVTVGTSATNLGFKVTGITQIEFYQDGKLIETGTTAANIADGIEMALSVFLGNEQNGSSNNLKIDWIRVAQLR